MERVKLKDICRLINGRAYKQEELLDSGKYPVLRVGNFFSDKDFYYSDLELEEDKYCDNGDLLFAWSASFGPKIWDGEKVIYHYHIWKMELTDRVNKEFLFYYLFHLSERIKSEGHGGIMIHTTKSEMEEREFNLPTHEEQIAISEILNKVKSVIDKRKEELSALDDLIKARFVEMFGNGHDGFCNTKKLGEFCKFQQGTQIPVEEQIEEQLESYTRFLRIIDYTQAPQIPRYVSVKGREIAEDSVVIVRYGATAGFVGHGYAGILANNLFEVVPDESILSKDFLYLALKYGTFEQEVHDKAFGAAMPALSFGMMNDIGVVTPNSTVQNGFVDFVKQVDKSKFKEKSCYIKYKILKIGHRQIYLLRK